MNLKSGAVNTGEKLEKFGEELGILSRILKRKGYEIREDNGIPIELEKDVVTVKSSYICLYGNRKLICIQHTSPSSTEPVKRFLISYARILGAPFAIIVEGGKVSVFETASRQEVNLDDLPDSKEAVKVSIDEKELDRRIVAAYYGLIHCSYTTVRSKRRVKEDEDYSICGISAERKEHGN